jgi:hypothetical protein
MNISVYLQAFPCILVHLRTLRTSMYVFVYLCMHLHVCLNVSVFLYIYFIWSRIRSFALRIIMGSGFDDWICWHFLTITINCKSTEAITL